VYCSFYRPASPSATPRDRGGPQRTAPRACESCSANEVSGARASDRLPGRSVCEVYPPQEGLVIDVSLQASTRARARARARLRLGGGGWYFIPLCLAERFVRLAEGERGLTDVLERSVVITTPPGVWGRGEASPRGHSGAVRAGAALRNAIGARAPVERLWSSRWRGEFRSDREPGGSRGQPPHMFSSEGVAKTVGRLLLVTSLWRDREVTPPAGEQ
jgi:hypothetical protein